MPERHLAIALGGLATRQLLHPPLADAYFAIDYGPPETQRSYRHCQLAPHPDYLNPSRDAVLDLARQRREDLRIRIIELEPRHDDDSHIHILAGIEGYTGSVLLLELAALAAELAEQANAWTRVHLHVFLPDQPFENVMPEHRRRWRAQAQATLAELAQWTRPARVQTIWFHPPTGSFAGWLHQVRDRRVLNDAPPFCLVPAIDELQAAALAAAAANLGESPASFPRAAALLAAWRADHTALSMEARTLLKAAEERLRPLPFPRDTADLLPEANQLLRTGLRGHGLDAYTHAAAQRATEEARAAIRELEASSFVEWRTGQRSLHSRLAEAHALLDEARAEHERWSRKADEARRKAALGQAHAAVAHYAGRGYFILVMSSFAKQERAQAAAAIHSWVEVEIEFVYAQLMTRRLDALKSETERYRAALATQCEDHDQAAARDREDAARHAHPLDPAQVEAVHAEAFRHIQFTPIPNFRNAARVLLHSAPDRFAAINQPPPLPPLR